MRSYAKHEAGKTAVYREALDQLLPGSDVVELEQPVVAGGMAYEVVKRLFDVVASGLALVVLLIPMGVVALAIRLDSPGRAIFAQERIGKGGKPFKIYKFRTMFADAHEKPGSYLTPEQMEVWEREQKVDDDSRITKVGRFLRRTSLDEVPQLWNVFIGQMSLVGPRPVTMAETLEFGGARGEFLSCKPGITGWWQVTDRNDATWANHKRQESELYYVRNRSISLDVEIILDTFMVMFVKKSGR